MVRGGHIRTPPTFFSEVPYHRHHHDLTRHTHHEDRTFSRYFMGSPIKCGNFLAKPLQSERSNWFFFG